MPLNVTILLFAVPQALAGEMPAHSSSIRRMTTLPAVDQSRGECMSVSGISSTNVLNYQDQNLHHNVRQFRQQLQQLGQDLQSGNLSAAQQDFSSLLQLGPQSNSTSAAKSNNPIAQDFKQLSKDLQAGDVTAARQDFARIQKDIQSQAAQSQSSHHHHHHNPRKQ
jgi:outer membrane protein assembly factor BamD (BamD/ComL family)